MGQLRVRVTKFTYKERDKRLKEQTINGINDQVMMAEIIKEPTAIKVTSEVTSELVLSCAKKIEPQQSQKGMLDSLKDSREFDMIGKTKCRAGPEQPMSRHTGTPQM